MCEGAIGRDDVVKRAVVGIYQTNEFSVYYQDNENIHVCNFFWEYQWKYPPLNGKDRG